jgi:Transcription termination factor nusG
MGMGLAMAKQENISAVLSPLLAHADIDSSGVLFPWWHVLLTEPNREERSAKWLERINLPVYLPQFARVVRCRGKSHRPRMQAVLPGLLFVPLEFMDLERRDEMLEWAHVRGFIRTSGGQPATMSKADINIIREIEAKLNLPREAKGVLFRLGERVRFVNVLYAAFWGTATIFEIAGASRIGVEVEKLFGQVTRVYVPESEIEAM